MYQLSINEKIKLKQNKSFSDFNEEKIRQLFFFSEEKNKILNYLVDGWSFLITNNSDGGL